MPRGTKTSTTPMPPGDRADRTRGLRAVPGPSVEHELHGIGRGVVDGDGRQTTCRRARRHRSPSRPSPRRGAGSPGGRRGLVASRPVRCRAPSPRRRRPLPGPAAVGQSFIGLRPWVMRNPRKMVNGTTLRVPVGLARHDPAIPRPGTAPTMGRNVRSASFEGRRFTTSSADGAERLLTEFRMHAAWILDRATQVARPMPPLRGVIALIEAFRLSPQGGSLLQRNLEVRCRCTDSGRGDLRGRS